MSSMYGTYKTDEQTEREGVYVNYGPFRVLLARAGGANKRFTKVLEAKARPYRRAIETETMDTDRALEIQREAFLETCVLGWDVKVGTEWVPGIEAPDGTVLPFNKENLAIAMRDLPDLLTDIMAQASKASLYRRAEKEAAAGNS